MAPPAQGPARANDLFDPPIPSYDEAVAGSGGAPSAYDAVSPNSPTGAAFFAADPEHESHSLLRRPHQRSASGTAAGGSASSTAPSSRPRPGGYRAPAVESDDEDSTWLSADSDDGHDHGLGDAAVDAETAHVRREMMELDMEDPLDAGSSRRWGRPSIFGKGFSLSLPTWASNWRLSMPRLRMRLPDGPPASGSGSGLVSRLRGLPRFTRLRSSDGDGDAGSGGGGGGGGGDDGAASTMRRWWQRLPRLPVLDRAIAVAIVGRVFALAVVLGLVYVLFMSDLFSGISRRLGSQVFDPESIRAHIQAMVSPVQMREMSRHFTSYAHLAGTEGDFALAVDTKNLFVKYGLEDVVVDEYYVYLNYPTVDGRAVEILGGDGKPAWTAKLEEEELEFKTKKGHQPYAFHGLSKAGDVRGPLLYANYGSRQDFQKLQDLGLNTTGAIALVRNGGSQQDRALKVKAAELAGFAGCLIYSDPLDEGFHRGKEAPAGNYMPADAVPRGSVSLMSWVIGDVLTPGWESKKGLPRLAPEKATGLVKIPSLPLAWRDAQVLLQHLQGHGQAVPDGWRGGVPDVDGYWTGDPSSSPLVRLKNEQDEVKEQPIWNVYGRIEGVEQSAKRLVLGNHRDAWSFGATDPHSGTAVMLEVARIFGGLLERGWRPLRTIEFMSWDAEEYNLIGSTEYVERNLDMLRDDALAYINLDSVVAGPNLRAVGSPVFAKVLMEVLKRVSAPNANASLHDQWEQRHGAIEVPGAGSDYVAFQDLAGTSSLDLYFDGSFYPLHSSYDNWDWMARVGDRDFAYHGAMAQVVGLLLIELADRPVMPFDMNTYGVQLFQWVRDLVTDIQGELGLARKAGHPIATKIEFKPIQAAASAVVKAINDFEAWAVQWQTAVLSAGGWESPGLTQQRIEYVHRMARFETDLLDLERGGGIPNRTQFKHVVFGPRLWASYEGELFPAVRDLMDAGQWVEVNQTLAKIANVFQNAAARLME